MKKHFSVIAAYLLLILALAATGCSVEDSAQTIDNATISTSTAIEESQRFAPPPSEKEEAEPAEDETAADETTGAEDGDTEQPDSFINQRQIEGGIVTAPPSSSTAPSALTTPIAPTEPSTPTQPTAPAPPSNPIPPSAPTPPNLVHEGELGEVIDYGVYCGTCGSLWDMEHNICPNCFPCGG